MEQIDDDVEAPGWIMPLAAALFVLCAVLSATFLLLTPSTPVSDEPEVDAPRSARPNVIVFESESCGWCKRFRASVAPRYELSATDSKAPLRYVDISAQRQSGYRLTSRVTTTPTFVLVDTMGREVGRLNGVPMGRGEFEKEIERLLEKIPAGSAG
jgi:thioredoxin-related protein